MPFEFAVPCIVPLQTPTDAIHDGHVLVIIRNMAGQDTYLSVKKITSVLGLRFHIAEMLSQHDEDIKFMLNFEQLKHWARFSEIQTVLEENGNVIHLLVDEPGPDERRCRNYINGYPCCPMLDDDEL